MLFVFFFPSKQLSRTKEQIHRFLFAKCRKSSHFSGFQLYDNHFKPLGTFANSFKIDFIPVLFLLYSALRATSTKEKDL